MRNLILNNYPIVSVVTVVYNNVDLIEKTILSVIDKNSPEIEYIIIDGGSTDGTVDFIKKYENRIDYWISESDKGIYDAMNKGVAVSKGDWIININAGDVLLDLPFDLLIESKKEKYDAFCGCVLLDTQKVVKPHFNWRIKIFNTLPHQGLFYYRQNIHEKYNILFRVYADYVYNIGMYKKKQRIFLSNRIISMHSTNGVSTDKSNSREFYKIVLDEHGFFFLILSFVYFKIQGVILRIVNLFE